MISLNGHFTDSNGYFVVGTVQVTPTPQIIHGTTLVPSKMSGAVAIYKVSSLNFGTVIEKVQGHSQFHTVL